MKKLLFITIMVGLYSFLLIGCAGEVSPIEIGVTKPLMTPLLTQATPFQSPIETAVATTTSSVKPELVNTPTLEPIATATHTAVTTTPMLLEPGATIPPVVCSQVKAYINIQRETNDESRRLMDFVFENEDTLTFLMWSDRPYPGPIPTPRTGPPTELRQSYRVLLKGQTWNFNSGTLIESQITGQTAMQNPCGQNCPLEVVSLAPDDSWQLLQVTDAPAEYQGLWLVNEDSVTHLIPYVPVDSQWQWSNDSRILWLIYTLHDISGESYGAESMVVDLSIPASPQIVSQSWESNEIAPNLLWPVEYEIVFSPKDKTVLSHEYIDFSEYLSADQLEVYQIDVSQNPPQLMDIYEAPYPFLIDWSDTLQDFLVLELSTTGAVIYALNHDITYEIPIAVIEQMPELFITDGQISTDSTNEDSVMRLYWNIDRVAISPDLQHMVLINEREVWVFSCSG